MNRFHARCEILVFDAFMVSGVVSVEKVEGFDAVAVVKFLTGLKPFSVAWERGAVWYRRS